MAEMDLWVQSELMPDGTYGVGITVGQDRAFILNRDEAVAYATACFASATEADHDTAVMRLLTKEIGTDITTAGQFVVELRPDRPDIKATEPLRFYVALGRAKHPRPDAGEFIPMLLMYLEKKQVGELTPADLRGHAAGVLNVLAAADLDANLRRRLMAAVGIPEEQARVFVESLADHMPDEGTPRRL